MTCEDCLHYEVCVFVAALLLEERKAENTVTVCGRFKDRTKWAEQKHGRCEWCEPGKEKCGTCLLFFDYYGDGGSDRCSGECDDEKCTHYIPMNHCPNCGAKMDEPKEIPWAGKTSGLTSRESNVGSKFDHASEGSGVTCAENGLVMDENDKTIYDRMKEIAPDDPKWLEGVDHLAAINAILYGLSEN